MKYLNPISTLLTLLFVGVFAWNGMAQFSEETLFMVNNKPVTVGEFDYIYQKNNSKDAYKDKKSVRDYLDLYIKFKLKVEEAKREKIDTIKQLQSDLRMYRQDLAKSYLTDKEVMNRLVEELYNRKKSDVDVSHILIAAGPKAAPSDTMRAYLQAKSIQQMLEHGQEFASLARKFSSDKNTAKKGGHVGFVTAKLPDGFYHLETAIYNTKPGNIAGPIRTRVGYHIIKVHKIRPARGMVKAAHILIRKAHKGQPDNKAKAKIEDIYKKLKEGATFEELANTYSEDKTSNRKGGEIGWFGINKFEDAFEEAAFSLPKNGAYSKPIETSIGWHIIKRLDKRDIGKLTKSLHSKLERKIREDSRFEIAQNALIDKIKSESGFKRNDAGLDKLAQQLDKSLFSYKWKAPQVSMQETLISLGGKDYKAKDLLNYFKRNSAVRLSMDENTSVKEGLNKLVDAFIKEKAIKYEERHLEEKYPEFKALMREYQEGILLFEASLRNVWNKASEDTSGLKAFHNAHRMDYMHPEKAMLATVSLSDISEKYAKKLYKRAMKKGLENALNKYRKKFGNLDRTNKGMTREDLKKKYPSLDFKKNHATDLHYDSAVRKASFSIITGITPAHPKSLNEARGYILSDYQVELDKEWVKTLRKRYPVKINEEVFEQLVQQHGVK